LESDWRWGVMEVGQSYTVYDLVARRTDDIRFWVFGYTGDRAAYFLGLQQLTPPLYVVPGPVTILPAPEPFPFGFPVLPDS